MKESGIIRNGSVQNQPRPALWLFVYGQSNDTGIGIRLSTCRLNFFLLHFLIIIKNYALSLFFVQSKARGLNKTGRTMYRGNNAQAGLLLDSQSNSPL